MFVLHSLQFVMFNVKHYRGLLFIIYHLLYRILNRAFLVVLITVDQLLNAQIQYPNAADIEYYM